MNIEHTIVYSDPAFYAGWPANHGAWQWGDEFLVGFMRGPYRRSSMHNIGQPFDKLLARSIDAGRSWLVEVPGVDFECHESQPVLPQAPAFDIRADQMRVCGVYDHGGDYCHEHGGFYLGKARGRMWAGPFMFHGLEQQLLYDGQICTSRTRVLDDLIFMSRGQRLIWGTDSVFCARHDGERFHFVSTVLEDDARAVMPAVARVGSRIVVAMRRRKSGRRDGWIDAVLSDDGGLSWSAPRQVGVTGSRNGNPPALAALPDGRLLACFANRSFGALHGAISEDRGESWSSFIIREHGASDIGYPQLFVRLDGVPVVVYYWAEEAGDAASRTQHIAATAIAGL